MTKQAFKTKSELIRAYPSSDVAAVIAAGKKSGMRVTPQDVHSVRSRDKASRRVKRTKQVAGDTEADFRRLVLRLGTERANALIRELAGDG